MKKVIVLILVTLMVTMLMAGCSSSNEVAELRQEVEEVQLELSQLKEQMCDTQSTTPDTELPEAPTETSKSETPEVKPSETTTKAVTSDMLDYLTIQLQSDYFADWDAVAKCDYATEEHLLTAAKQCVTISATRISWAEKIATSICENPAATGKVIKELSNSQYYKIWNIAAQSTHADEKALISIAKQCAAISNSPSWAEKIATSICENPAVTSKVLKELSNSNYTDVTNIGHAKLEELLR